MSNPHLILCNGTAHSAKRPREWSSIQPQELKTFGQDSNVTMQVTDLTDRMVEQLPAVVLDLMELAALVYAADQCCKRKGGTTIDWGAKWHRTFRFEVPVRAIDFWNQPEVNDELVETLGFLTDDNFEFSFSRLKKPPPFHDYLDFSATAALPDPVERVVLFSGGLDSLAGAVQEILVDQRRVALVSHKPVDHLAKKQRELVAEITKRAGGGKLTPLHFPVMANKAGHLTLDYTQRSRSFLYASMATAVAQFFELNEIYFYENGVFSVNLPLAGQEVGSRATRTTHPQALYGFGRLFTRVLKRAFAVRNDFFWLTKQDVLTRLRNTEHHDLARNSLSCTHTRGFTLVAPHCGMCSQCLSRFVAARGADYGDNDPESGYRNKVLIGQRKKDGDRILGERFVGMARLIEDMTTVDQFTTHFAGELGRVYPYLGMSSRTAAEKLFDLHRQHAVQVGSVMLDQMQQHLEERRRGKLSNTCVLNYAFDLGYRSKPKSPEDAARELRQRVKRLNEMERNSIEALYEQRVIGLNAPLRPGQKELSEWAGYKFDAQFKAALSSLVKAGYIDNGRHHGRRGGYFLTPVGKQAGQLLFDQVMTSQD